MIYNDKELALDDEQIRRLNTEKVINTVEKIGDFLEEGRKTNMVSKYYLLFIVLLIALMFVGASIMVATKSGGIANFIDNYWIIDNINHRIVCYYEDYNMTFREPQSSYYFMKTFNISNCKIFIK